MLTRPARRRELAQIEVRFEKRAYDQVGPCLLVAVERVGLVDWERAGRRRTCSRGNRRGVLAPVGRMQSRSSSARVSIRGSHVVSAERCSQALETFVASWRPQHHTGMPSKRTKRSKLVKGPPLRSGNGILAVDATSLEWNAEGGEGKNCRS